MRRDERVSAVALRDVPDGVARADDRRVQTQMYPPDALRDARDQRAIDATSPAAIARTVSFTAVSVESCVVRMRTPPTTTVSLRVNSRRRSASPAARASPASAPETFRPRFSCDRSPHRHCPMPASRNRGSSGAADVQVNFNPWIACPARRAPAPGRRSSRRRRPCRAPRGS